MSPVQVSKGSPSLSFNNASLLRKPQRSKGLETKPFCIRLTDDERGELEDRAGKLPLGTWAREELLGAKAQKRKKRPRLRQPKATDKNVALVLALLGDQRIASNLNQMARHANMGTLDFDDHVLDQIVEACAAMVAIRKYLLDE